jgi:hypothetical protein
VRSLGTVGVGVGVCVRVGVGAAEGLELGDVTQAAITIHEINMRGTTGRRVRTILARLRSFDGIEPS